MSQPPATERTALVPPTREAGPADPSPFLDKNEDPKSWPSSRKWLFTLVVACYGLVSPMAAAMVVPALRDMARDLHMMDDGQQQMLMSVFVLGWGLGPLVMGPLSEVYGRVLLLNAGHSFFLLTNTLCAFVRDKRQFIILRLLSGFFGSGPLSLGAGVLSDLWTQDERGLSLAVYTVMPLIGPAIGPIAAAYITQRWPWPWIFHASSAFAAITLLFGLVSLQETYRPILLRRKLSGSGLTAIKSNVSLRTNLVRPFILLGTQPIIQIIALFMAYLFGLNHLTISTFQAMWQEMYDQSPSRSSLNYLSVTTGFVVGCEVAGPLNDKIYAHLKKIKKSPGIPEFRTALMVPAAILVPIGQLWYGWTAQAQLHWLLPNAGIAVYCFGLIVGYQCIQSYVLDCYPVYAASAVAALTLPRSLTGFAFPVFAPALYRALGYGWTSVVLAAVTLVVGCSAPPLLRAYGPALRARSRFAAGNVGGGV
ncbi:putative bicyclomycin resistance protein [Macrophomina phaseolina]|uniref:Bicyclomycin resistance protein n=1 Tax=Macrophomina phaseolina TaxID=35725 RepID=A0ABQ8FQ43_9PEZI|nr:putative bicyclomycin resistance protein [Macrophomina phaseolina]